jgi:hypothetical protein
MDIHEHQAKDILAGFGLPVPQGGLAFSPEQAAFRAQELGGEMWAVKAQIHSGGRGEAGGVKLCRSDAEVRDFAATLLGKRLATRQTGAPGKLVDRVWVERATPIARELYLGFVLDRKTERIMIVASAAGWHRDRGDRPDRPGQPAPHGGSIPRSALRPIRRANWPLRWGLAVARFSRWSPRCAPVTGPIATLTR